MSVAQQRRDGEDDQQRDAEAQVASRGKGWTSDLKDIVLLAGPAILQLAFQQAVIVTNQSMAGQSPSEYTFSVRLKTLTLPEAIAATLQRCQADKAEECLSSLLAHDWDLQGHKQCLQYY